MKAIWIAVLVYVFLIAILLGLNADYFLALYEINFLLFKKSVYFLPVLVIVSLIFLLFVAVVATLSIDRLRKSVVDLKAELYERKEDKLDELQNRLEAMWAQFHDEIMKVLQEMEKKSQ